MSRAIKLTGVERFCLDAYIVNRDADTAYRLSRPTPPTTTKPDILHRMALRWLRGDAVRDYLRRRSAANSVGGFGAADGAGNRSDADIIRDLNGLLNQTDDPKLKAQMLLQLAQLKGMTRRPERTMPEETHVNYYLPARCEVECPLYVGFGKYLKENGLKPASDTQAKMIEAYSRLAYRSQLEKARGAGRGAETV